MSWYTRFRPRQIGDLHLESVRTQLRGYMKSGNFPKVFLFAGPKGTGKTSASRILGALFNDPINDAVVQADFFGESHVSSSQSSSKPSKTPEKLDKKSAITQTQNSLHYQEPDQNSKQNEAIFSGQSYIVNELDAASNRGIDDIRSLKERVSVLPQEGKVSVYILDEAHMLTTEAFNALLKVLEEPPKHVVFILATTELHKIPATILSRTTVVPFQKATIDEILQSYAQILGSVNLTAPKEVLENIATRADGSFRDAVKFLEQVAIQVISTGKSEISATDVEAHLKGYAQNEQLTALITAVVQKDASGVATRIAQLRSQSIDPATLYTQLLSYLHDSLLQSLEVKPGKAQFSKQVALFFLNELQDISHQTEIIPLLALELKLLSIIDRAMAKNTDASGTPTSGGVGSKVDTSRGIKQTSQTKSASSTSDEDINSTFSSYAELETTSEELIPVVKMDTVLTNLSPVGAPEITKSDSLVNLEHMDSKVLLEQWGQFVEMVANQNATVAGLLRSAKPMPEKSNGIARIQVYYQFHKDQLMQPKFLQLFQECAQAMTGQAHRFEFELGKAQDTQIQTKNITNISRSTTAQADATLTLAGEVLM